MPSSSRQENRRRSTPRSGGYLRKNLRDWERSAARYEELHAKTLRREDGKAWGTLRIPERRLRLLGAPRGKRVLELGCGAADWSIALAREGADVVGLDFSGTRLRQAQDRLRKAGLSFPLVRARADKIPYPNGRFDIVLSDYGATTFSDPWRTIPEASRVLRRDGLLVFAHANPFRSVAHDRKADRLTRTLARDYFGLRTLHFPDSVEFQLPFGEWIRLFSSCGLVVDRLIEPAAPTSWRTSYLSADEHRWALHWPVDAIWKLRKVGLARRLPARERSLGRSRRSRFPRQRMRSRPRRGTRRDRVDARPTHSSPARKAPASARLGPHDLGGESD